MVRGGHSVTPNGNQLQSGYLPQPPPAAHLQGGRLHGAEVREEEEDAGQGQHERQRAVHLAGEGGHRPRQGGERGEEAPAGRGLAGPAPGFGFQPGGGVRSRNAGVPSRPSTRAPGNRLQLGKNPRGEGVRVRVEPSGAKCRKVLGKKMAEMGLLGVSFGIRFNLVRPPGGKASMGGGP